MNKLRDVCLISMKLKDLTAIAKYQIFLYGNNIFFKHQQYNEF